MPPASLKQFRGRCGTLAGRHTPAPWQKRGPVAYDISFISFMRKSFVRKSFVRKHHYLWRKSFMRRLRAQTI